MSGQGALPCPDTRWRLSRLSHPSRPSRWARFLMNGEGTVPSTTDACGCSVHKSLNSIPMTKEVITTLAGGHPITINELDMGQIRAIFRADELTAADRVDVHEGDACSLCGFTEEKIKEIVSVVARVGDAEFSALITPLLQALIARLKDAAMSQRYKHWLDQYIDDRPCVDGVSLREIKRLTTKAARSD